MTQPAVEARARRREQGLTYVEVLVATMLIALSLVPALEALESGLASLRVQESLTQEHYAAAGRLEELLGEPFASLDAEAQTVGDPSLPTSYSDAAGTAPRRLVYLSRYDGDDADADGNPFTGIDDGLLWLRVEIEGAAHGFETLRAR